MIGIDSKSKSEANPESDKPCNKFPNKAITGLWYSHRKDKKKRRGELILTDGLNVASLTPPWKIEIEMIPTQKRYDGNLLQERVPHSRPDRGGWGE